MSANRLRSFTTTALAVALLPLLVGCPALPEDNGADSGAIDSSKIKSLALPEKYEPGIGKRGGMRIISRLS